MKWKEFVETKKKETRKLNVSMITGKRIQEIFENTNKEEEHDNGHENKFCCNCNK